MQNAGSVHTAVVGFSLVKLPEHPFAADCSSRVPCSAVVLRHGSEVVGQHRDAEQEGALVSSRAKHSAGALPVAF